MPQIEAQEARPQVPEDEPTTEDLRVRIDALERQLRDTIEMSQTRLARAELKAVALQAGMIDLDGLKLVDLSHAKLNEHGEVEGGAELMAELKREKPWLFGGASSSSRANPPPAHPPRVKLATEMTPDEYRAARAEVLRRR